ncbi:MAG: hypothetical protein C5B59_05925 [Bacteroidetes bacterium]|nr:MAG: hypothetical protein C5B59_05925 [Bacteroidota bacterium]
MKKNILTTALVFTVAILAVASKANAQGSANKQKVSYPEKLIISDNTSNPAAVKDALAKSKINVKALLDFQKAFTNIGNEKWYKENYGYSARFFENGIQNDVSYSDKGERLYQMKQFNENNLSRELRTQIKTAFYDCSVKWVHEIIFPHKTVYIVLIEDEATLKNIRIGDDEMEVVEEVTKS